MTKLTKNLRTLLLASAFTLALNKVFAFCFEAAADLPNFRPKNRTAGPTKNSKSLSPMSYAPNYVPAFVLAQAALNQFLDGNTPNPQRSDLVTVPILVRNQGNSNSYALSQARMLGIIRSFGLVGKITIRKPGYDYEGILVRGAHSFEKFHRIDLEATPRDITYLLKNASIAFDVPDPFIVWHGIEFPSSELQIWNRSSFTVTFENRAADLPLEYPNSYKLVLDKLAFDESIGKVIEASTNKSGQEHILFETYAVSSAGQGQSQATGDLSLFVKITHSLRHENSSNTRVQFTFAIRLPKGSDKKAELVTYTSEKLD